jgi:hypothetical protein
MALRLAVSRIAAVLGFLAVLAFGGREANANGGIAVTSGMTQETGDPKYEYIFEINLLAGSTLPVGGFFTIYDLPALTAGATTSQPAGGWGGSVKELGMTPMGTVVNDSLNSFNATWQWDGDHAIVAPADSDYVLGTFVVGSTTELPSPPVVTMAFVGSLDGLTAANQGFVFINSVPEPSSLIMFLAGVGTLPLYWLHKRQRRR